MSSSSRGALAELLVAADLMARGYEVFRAVSPSASCDLTALKDGLSLRVEVRTGRRMPGGGLGYLRARLRADVVAVYVHAEQTTYYVSVTTIPSDLLSISSTEAIRPPEGPGDPGERVE